MAVSASVIASASGLGLPVSTTYVGFAAVVAQVGGIKFLQAVMHTSKLAVQFGLLLVGSGAFGSS